MNPDGSVFGFSSLDRAIKESDARLDAVESGIGVDVNRDGVGVTVGVSKGSLSVEGEARRSFKQRAWDLAARLRWKF